MNPTSYLILNVRLTREVAMNKKARASQKFIHWVHLQKRFLEREKKRRVRVLERFLNQEREDIPQHGNRGADQNL